MDQILFQQLLDGKIEYEDVSEYTDMKLTDDQKHEMRLWLIGLYGFSYQVAKGYIT
ncbi:hypothetical protein ABEY63_00990 [Priestia aryabhattai]|uniref:hypothetical protein n=1 Tax=Priestia aryabhattai TaxID=412384 RepID=UPI002E1ADA17|nr:hypothetical protein [Priestia aryabhattai]MED4259726.1 hypothetical protein [Priestia aryabhattai]